MSEAREASPGSLGAGGCGDPRPAPAFSPEQTKWLSDQLALASEEAARLGIEPHLDMARRLRYQLFRAGLAVMA